MKCPKCNAPLIKDGLEHLVHDEIFESWACQTCGYREEKKKSKL